MAAFANAAAIRGVAASLGGRRARNRLPARSGIPESGERKICLCYTGRLNAGENIAQDFAHRVAGAPVPLQMCDL